MKKHTVTYERFDVVVVPFPFTDKDSVKKRPALVISDKTFQAPIHHSTLAMITSSGNPEWPLDVDIQDLQSAGLPSSSKVRMKIFTIDNELIIRKIGSLSRGDRKSVQASIRKLMKI